MVIFKSRKEIMPEDNTTAVNPTNDAAVSGAPATDASTMSVPTMSTPAVATPSVDAASADALTQEVSSDAAMDKKIEVGQKIAEAHNVLIALSADPSVDEMAAAIGLSLYLDRLGKRATAIYSGSTPNALEFLKPEETFEESVDTLQDFVIALNKEKADHLRYKLDGDYVKIYITPYKTRIDEEDLEFSYGDFNVDLVLALDVANGIDLDSALREHGRIMHDAVIVNITTGNPGKLGEIEWSEKTASSVCEMIADLLYKANSKIEIEKEEATAFLTGIVAATNRFSNAKTTPDTMAIASKLMESGANQQLISKNITPDVENEMFSMPGFVTEKKKKKDASKLDIQHGNEVIEEDNPEEVDAPVTEKSSTLLDELKAAEATLMNAGAETVPDVSNEPVKVDEIDNAIEEKNKAEKPMTETAGASETVEPVASEGAATVNPVVTPSEPANNAEAATEPSVPSETTEQKGEKVLQPTGNLADLNPADETTNFVGDVDSGKYGKMLEEALANAGDVPAPVEAPIVGDDSVSPAAETTVTPANDTPMNDAGLSFIETPVMNIDAAVPPAPEAPEINGVPEINYMPMPDDNVLPPPPAPPVDFSAPAV